MTKNTTINLRVNADVKEQEEIIVVYTHTPRPKTLTYIERTESGEEELVGSFSSKKELWRSLGI